MRVILGLAAGILVLTGAHGSRADDTSKVMCEQFAINGATKTVMPTSRFDADFAPPHHAPRNIPIEVAVPENADAFIHFPIVQNGTYVIYATDPGRLAGLKEKDGKAISVTAAEAPKSCAEVLKGGFSADVNVGKLSGPNPIAIEFKKGPAEVVRLIVSRDPIN